MIEELQKRIVANLLEIIGDIDLEETRNLGKIRKNTISIGEDFNDAKNQALSASLLIDCEQLPNKTKTLNYCTCIYAPLTPEQKFTIRNFFVQEQVGVLFGVPIHGNPIKNEEQILLVLSSINEELEKVILERHPEKKRTSK